MHVIVAEVEDEGILGMDFLSQADSHIDIVKNQVSINGEVFDCSDFKNQPLSSRCVVQWSTVIEPNTEVIVPVTVHKRSSNLNPKASQLGIRLLELCLTSHLHQRASMLQGLWWTSKWTELFLNGFLMFLTKFST